MGSEDQMIKALFFDLYGTLIDIKTDEQDPWAYDILSRYFQYHSLSIGAEDLKVVYFGEIEQHLRQSGEVYPEVDVYKIFNLIMNRYGTERYPKSVIVDAAMLFRSLTMKKFALFPHLFETLTRIEEQYKIAIISDAQWVFAEPEVAMLGLDRFFQQRILSSHYGYKKPDVRLFHAAMKKLRVKPEESVYVGDNLRKDLIGAKRAGIRFIYFGPEMQEYNGFKPDGAFSDYSELERVIAEIL
jgi:putative hydrolase of the HAD superfamily